MNLPKRGGIEQEFDVPLHLVDEGEDSVAEESDGDGTRGDLSMNNGGRIESDDSRRALTVPAGAPTMAMTTALTTMARETITTALTMTTVVFQP